MVNELYQLFDVSASDVSYAAMTSHATIILVAGVIAIGIIIGLIISSLLRFRR